MNCKKWLRRAAALILAAGLGVHTVPFVQAASKTEEKQMSYASYVDTLFGLNSATAAGPTLPSGSIHPSPETLSPDCGGYSRNKPIIGFGQLYFSGTGGTKSFGNFLLAPDVGGIELDANKRAVAAVSESGTCYEYAVELQNGIGVRVTPAQSSAIYEIEYPAGQEATLLIDVARKLGSDTALKTGSVTVDPQTNTVSGGGTYGGNWNGIPWEMYFALSFDAGQTQLGTFQESTLTPTTSKTTVSISSPQRLGAYATFAPGSTVKVKIAISFESEHRAKTLLSEHIPDYDYDAVREVAKQAWDETLGVIEIEGDQETLRRFYTAMYHLNIQPRDRTNDHGYWDDFHTIWDSWRTVFPLYSLLYPERMGNIVDSLIDRAQANAAAGNGIVLADDFSAAKEYLAGQGGNDIDNVIADAYLKGVPLHDHTWQEAYEVLLQSAEKMRSPQYINKGYVVNDKTTVSGVSYSSRFKPAAATMGFAFSDFSVAQMAKTLGTEAEYDKYLARSQNWKNVWNDALESEGFYGFPQNPLADGSFAPGHNAHGGYNSHYYETTGWEASYVPYFDVEGLIDAMGGRETFVQRLLWACEHSVNYYNDDGGAEGYLNFTNEPGFHIPWLFCHDAVKRPDLAAAAVDSVLDRFAKMENDYPGDEDNGGMSSYYVFMMCGFFPYATTNDYYLHGTRLEKVTIHLDNGKDFVITGENVGGDNIYVQSATWQGKAWDSSKLTYEQILQGGELHFVMGEQASDWARISDDTAPLTPEALTGSEDADAMGTAILQWEAPTDDGIGNAYYEIYRSVDKNFVCDETTMIGRSYTNEYRDTPAIATRYYYGVVAVGEYGKRSDVCRTRVDLHYDAQAPDAPTGLEVNASLLSQGTVSLSWQAAKDNVGVVSYNIYRGTSEQDLLNSQRLIAVTRECTLADLPTTVGTYYYLIICRDAYGNISAPSQTLRIELTAVNETQTEQGNIAQDKSVTVNGQTKDTEAGPMAVDGKLNTKWCVKPDASGKHFIEIDLGKSVRLGRWVVHHAQAGGESPFYNTEDFTLSYWNGVAWVLADTVEGNHASVTDRTFMSVITNKVRMDITQAIQSDLSGASGINTSNIARIYEIELYSPTAAEENTPVDPSAEYAITTDPCDGAEITVDREAAKAGQTVSFDVNYVLEDRLFSHVLVYGESGTPVSVTRTEGTMTFTFTQPGEQVTIRVYSTLQPIEQTEPDTGDDVPPPAPNGSPLPLIAGIAAGVLVLAAAATVLLLKKKKKK